jgi:hypothetical protein
LGGAAVKKYYWDLFALNINQSDFYWNFVNGGSGSLSDPVVDNVPAGTPTVSFGAIDGVTWGWGGKDYAAGARTATSRPGAASTPTARSRRPPAVARRTCRSRGRCS